jgi:hypothetical protein
MAVEIISKKTVRIPLCTKLISLGADAAITTNVLGISVGVVFGVAALVLVAMLAKRYQDKKKSERRSEIYAMSDNSSMSSMPVKPTRTQSFHGLPDAASIQDV